jgi:PAS domain S-box-containing protein
MAKRKAKAPKREPASPQAPEKLGALLDLFGRHFPGHTMQRMRTPDGRYRYTYVSPGMRETFGLDPEAIIAQPATDHAWLPPAARKRFLAALERSARTLETLDEEVPIRHPNGKTKWVRSIGHPRRTPDGSVIWDGVALDVTDRHEARFALDRALKLARRNEVSDLQLSAIAARDLSSPMQSAKEAIATLGRSLSSDKQRALFAEVEKSFAVLETTLPATIAVVKAKSLAAQHVQDSNGYDRDLARAHDTLTAAQSKVLELVSIGFSNQAIAEKLKISVGTVKLHVSAILKKLHAKNRTEAARFALRRAD